MTPRRRTVLLRYLRSGNAKACGVDASLVRRWVRAACAHYDCSEFELLIHMTRRERHAAPVAMVPLWDLPSE